MAYLFDFHSKVFTTFLQLAAERREALVRDSFVCPQIYAPIFSQKFHPSMGKVFTTAHFGVRTPESIGEFARHPLKKTVFRVE